MKPSREFWLTKHMDTPGIMMEFYLEESRIYLFRGEIYAGDGVSLRAFSLPDAIVWRDLEDKEWLFTQQDRLGKPIDGPWSVKLVKIKNYIVLKTEGKARFEPDFHYTEIEE